MTPLPHQAMTTRLLAYDPNNVKPGWIAFFVVLALVIATVLLWRNMNTQLGRIKVPPRAAFRTGAAQAPTADDERAAAANRDDEPGTDVASEPPDAQETGDEAGNGNGSPRDH